MDPVDPDLQQCCKVNHINMANLHLDPNLWLALLNERLHDEPGSLHNGERGVLEQPEQSAAPRSNFF